MFVAISGAQGSGKTSLAEILTEQLLLSGVSAVACSLDDFYLTRARRIELARTVHPLLITRGVPGTHDVDLCIHTLDDVTRSPTAMPKFDKGLDDRVERSAWPMAGFAEVVIIEGWCLGARPQPAADLVAPINELERDEDADGRFRAYVNEALGRYQTLVRTLRSARVPAGARLRCRSTLAGRTGTASAAGTSYECGAAAALHRALRTADVLDEAGFARPGGPDDGARRRSHDRDFRHQINGLRTGGSFIFGSGPQPYRAPQPGRTQENRREEPPRTRRRNADSVDGVRRQL